jgi:CheY-like chemotaxis protein
MVYGFVKQSRGHVRLHSEMGTGTSVRIHLPRSVASHANEGVGASAQGVSTPAESARAREGETVLLVEDNEQVRALGVAALENLGYRVLEASDGQSALRLLDGGAARVDLLFSDVVLPGGMSGPELAAASSARRPGLPVLFASGYTRKSGNKDDPLRSDAPMLRKPYALDALASAVRCAIDAAASRSSP